MVVLRRPISVTSGGRKPFQKAIADAASEANPAMRLLEHGPLYCRIVWFHNYRTDQDVDNIAKRIIDSLIGVVYSTDLDIVRCSLEKVYIAETYSLDVASLPLHMVDMLPAILSVNHPDVLYIEVGQIRERIVRFG